MDQFITDLLKKAENAIRKYLNQKYPNYCEEKGSHHEEEGNTIDPKFERGDLVQIATSSEEDNGFYKITGIIYGVPYWLPPDSKIRPIGYKFSGLEYHHSNGTWVHCEGKEFGNILKHAGDSLNKFPDIKAHLDAICLSPR